MTSEKIDALVDLGRAEDALVVADEARAELAAVGSTGKPEITTDRALAHARPLRGGAQRGACHRGREGRQLRARGFTQSRTEALIWLGRLSEALDELLPVEIRAERREVPAVVVLERRAAGAARPVLRTTGSSAPCWRADGRAARSSAAEALGWCARRRDARPRLAVLRGARRPRLFERWLRCASWPRGCAPRSGRPSWSRTSSGGWRQSASASSRCRRAPTRSSRRGRPTRPAVPRRTSSASTPRRVAGRTIAVAWARYTALDAIGRADEDAIASLKAFADAHLDSPRRAAYVHTLVDSGETGEAVEAVAERLEGIDAAWLGARAAYRAGDAEGALRLARQVVEEDAEALSAHQLAALACESLGDFRDALEHRNAVLAGVPEDDNESAHWDRLVPATIVGDWEAVRASARQLGMEARRRERPSRPAHGPDPAALRRARLRPGRAHRASQRPGAQRRPERPAAARRGHGRVRRRADQRAGGRGSSTPSRSCTSSTRPASAPTRSTACTWATTPGGSSSGRSRTRAGSSTCTRATRTRSRPTASRCRRSTAGSRSPTTSTSRPPTPAWRRLTAAWEAPFTWLPLAEGGRRRVDRGRATRAHGGAGAVLSARARCAGAGVARARTGGVGAGRATPVGRNRLRRQGGMFRADGGRAHPAGAAWRGQRSAAARYVARRLRGRRRASRRRRARRSARAR